MQDYRHEFLAFAVERGVLRFGEFTLKSGRVSPYFFNTGGFRTGGDLARLGRYFTRALEASAPPYDMLFGPAYKGIPLVAAVAIALALDYGREVPYAFNRKEAKGHGEGGGTVGAPLAGRVLIVDDVISAGTSVHESVEIIRAAGATPAGLAIALDRQERGRGERSAVEEVEARYGLPVVCIARLDDLIEFLETQGGQPETLEAIRAYRDRYGV